MINYILIGTVFMFIVEYFSQSKIIDKYVPKKKRKKMKKNFNSWGMKERIVGILGLPILLLIFLYNFLKQLFK